MNPYLKEELIIEALKYFSKNKGEIIDIFGDFIVMNRFESLLKLSEKKSFSLDIFLDLCRINYIAPCNAANTDLRSQSVDFYSSYCVFEHIPYDILKQILQEGNRIIAKEGLFIHKIDYSDHYSHSDKKISAINFLKFTDSEWEKYAGNKYMYVNRLRHDDFMNLFHSSGHSLLDNQPDVDDQLKELLNSGKLKVDTRFSEKSNDILSVLGSWIISRQNN